MKIKKGLRWKSIEGVSKGKEFVVIDVDKDSVQYKSEETGQFYTEDRKNFEKRMERVTEYWNSSNKTYKRNKEKLKGEL